MIGFREGGRRKQFFFKKKNQKTFAPLRAALKPTGAKKFLRSFFQKATACLPFLDTFTL